MNGPGFRAHVEQFLAPALNPIELAFAKLKALLRSAGERTVDALWDRIGEPIDRFQPTE